MIGSLSFENTLIPKAIVTICPKFHILLPLALAKSLRDWLLGTGGLLAQYCSLISVYLNSSTHARFQQGRVRPMLADINA